MCYTYGYSCPLRKCFRNCICLAPGGKVGKSCSFQLTESVILNLWPATVTFSNLVSGFVSGKYCKVCQKKSYMKRS